MLNNDFMSFYEELSTLYEAKNKKTSGAIKQSGPTFSEHLKSLSSPLNSIIPTVPTEIAGYKINVTPRFISEFGEIKEKYTPNDVERLCKDITKVLSLLRPDGRFNHNSLGTEKLNDSAKDNLGCRWGRLTGTPVRSHVVILSDSQTKEKFFIITTLFLHRSPQWTKAEITAGNNEYDKLVSYFKNPVKKIG